MTLVPILTITEVGLLKQKEVGEQNLNALESGNQPSEHQSVTVDKFSTQDKSTFRLNLDFDDDDDTPILSKVIDYTSFRQRDVVPHYDDIITAEVVKDPEEWEKQTLQRSIP